MRQYLSILVFTLLIFASQFSRAEENIDIYFEGYPRKTSLKVQNNGLLDMSELINKIDEIPERAPYEWNLDQLERIEKNIRQQKGKVYEDIVSICKKVPACIDDAKKRLTVSLQISQLKMEKMILFPKNTYHPIRIQTSSTSTQKAEKALDCNACNSYAIRSSIWFDSVEDYSAIYNKIKEKEKNCIAEVLNELSKEIRNTRSIPRECLKSENQTNIVCKTMNKDISIRQQRIEDLTALLNANDISNTESSVCLLPDDRTNWGLSDMQNFLDESMESYMCSPLQPGETKRIKPASAFGVTPPYTIQKKPDGSYSITLNMHFTAGEDYDGHVPKDSVPEFYLMKAQLCMSLANSKLLGPDGEKLNIVISSPENSSPADSSPSNDCEKLKLKERLKSKEIKIRSTNYRDNAENYSAEIDCPTILHEVLHQLGLSDEYNEIDDHHKEMPETGIISRILQNIEYAIFGAAPPPEHDCRFVSENSIMGDYYNRWDSIFEDKAETSLLSPRHFDFILYGECQEKNQLYNECTEQAYSHSRDDPSCLEKKEKCEDRYN